MIKNALGFLSFCLILACSNTQKESIEFIEIPTGENSSEPSLHLSESGDIYLSWLETNDNESTLLFSNLNESSWSQPTQIASGEDWFVNWADFPSITSFGKDNLVSHFLDKSAPDTYAYDVKLTISTDKGNSWSSPVLAHHDGTHTEHGFASKIALDNETFMAVWLDGRQNHYAELDSTFTHQMTLRSGIFDKTGNIIEKHEIDNRVCDCCQTDLAMTVEGPLVVYRNRSDDEMRDTFYSKYSNGSWSQPQAVYNDDWKIQGCPVNGPAIAVKNNVLAVTWFTIANNQPKVKLAFSTDHGNTFNTPLTIDESEPIGRLDLEMIDAKNALLSWMDSEDGLTKIKLQRININGELTQPKVIVQSSESRSSGFPRMVVKDNFAYLAWTNAGQPLSISSAKIDLESL